MLKTSSTMLIASKDMYVNLFHNRLSNGECKNFVEDMLHVAKSQSNMTLPTMSSFNDLDTFIHSKHEDALKQYSQYLNGRKMGKKRTLFKDTLHAKWYLVQIAPTKMVDGVWLSGISSLPDSSVKSHLKRIYLDECGDYNYGVDICDGNPNHVEVYKRLLNSLFQSTLITDNVYDWLDHPFLDKTGKFDLFLPGCVQMALGQTVHDFLPEIIGYNLGYEQIALHMLLTSYELKELCIDPTYFDLHITVDNLDCGHAKQALQTVKAFLDTSKNWELDMQRIMLGYMLSEMMPCAFELVQHYNIVKIVEHSLQQKSKLSYSLHDNIVDNGINLGSIMGTATGTDLLEYLVENGYFDEEVFERCKFVQLLGDKMLGTFTADEVQFLKAWFYERNGNIALCASDEKICSLIHRAIHKHTGINMTHPLTGETDTMTSWYNRDKRDFMLCLSTPEMKKKTYDSFNGGRMRNVRITEEDRDLLYRWCKSIN